MESLPRMTLVPNRTAHVHENEAVPARDMPAAEVHVDEALVRTLLRAQAPSLSDLPITLAANGWDNAVFRLGDDLCVRVPRRQMGAELIASEQRWLPELAPRLPLPVPAPVFAGAPGEGYPWAWSVVPWFDGDAALHTPPADPRAAASALGEFVAALHTPAPPDAPTSPGRGVPLSARDDGVRRMLAALHDVVDTGALAALWSSLVALPSWPGAPVWVHGDLHPANLVVDRGVLSAVIDFGDLNGGDPATDLMGAWMLFDPVARKVFRDAAGVDDDTWARGRGWALVVGLALVASSADNPPFAALGHRALEAVLAGN